MANGSSTRRYIVSGYDLTNRLIQVEGLSTAQTKPEWGGMPSIPDISLNFVNEKDEMSASGQNGFFFGKTIRDMTLQIYRKEGSLQLLEWFGNLDSIVEDFEAKKVTVHSVSPFSTKLDLPALVTLGISTPAALSRAVFELYDIPINVASFNAADAFLTTLVTCQVDPNLFSSTITLMELQKQLAVAGAARIYFYNGEMYYECYNTGTPTITFTLDDWDLMTDLLITTEEKKFTTYNVKYLFGAVDSVGYVSGASSTSLDFGPNSPVKIQSLTGAQYVADTWEEISKLKQRRFKFGIPRAQGNYLGLNSAIELNYSVLGAITTPLTIESVDRTNIRYTVIEGLTL